MDGNGRWAKKIGLRRDFGHQAGVKSVNHCVEGASEIGIKNITLYVFSMENWKRPKIEVKALMRLLVISLKKELINLMKNDIKLSLIGYIDSLDSKTKKKLTEVINKTSKNKKLNFNISYLSIQIINCFFGSLIFSFLILALDSNKESSVL